MFPPWPANAGSADRGYSGTIRVLIGTDGKVKSAAIEEGLHPQYDLELLRAARSWLYRPAMRNGEPVESEKLIGVQVSGR